MRTCLDWFWRSGSCRLLVLPDRVGDSDDGAGQPLMHAGLLGPVIDLDDLEVARRVHLEDGLHQPDAGVV